MLAQLMKEYLFSYGTLQKEKVQIKLFGRILQGAKDTLGGYKVSPIEIKDESFLSKGEQKNQLIAIISKDKNDCIKGTVLEITGEELSLADKYEPVDYKRVKVILESGKEAWIYAAVETP
ncbi:MAG: gamma-glutamylcyclotransferase family protein [Bacteroidota bacterium]|nr:gamma-glutamylcyclotransferase family protein [Bacteroidota bacterium]